MAEVTNPQTQPISPPQPALGFSITVTTAVGAIISTDYDCYGVLIQSSSLNDSNASVTGKMFVSLGGVKAYELVQGESVFVPCSNTSEVKVITQSGTAWARGLIYRALKQ